MKDKMQRIRRTNMTPKEQHHFEETLASIELTLPLVTQTLMVYYKALVHQGFTKDEALYLVGVHGTTLGYKECK